MIACWSYDSLNKLMVTYDTSYSASAKADYIKQQKLGGAMWWESSGDRTDDKSIVNSVCHSQQSVESRLIIITGSRQAQTCWS